MLKIFKIIFFFKVVKTNTKKERLEKRKKEKLLLLIPENIGDRVLSVNFFLVDCQPYTFLLMNMIISDILIQP